MMLDAGRLRANVPAELARSTRWVATRGKKPLSPKTGEARGWNEGPRRWATMEEAIEFAERTPDVTGVSLVLHADDGLVFLDLDHVVLEDGDLEPWAVDVLGECTDTYAEKSTNDGVHIILRARWQKGWRTSGAAPGARPHLEMYGGNRHVVFTGLRLDGHPTCVAGPPLGLLERLQFEHFSVRPEFVNGQPDVEVSTASRAAPGAALEHAAGRVASTREGARNNELNAAAFSMGKLVGDGTLDEDVVVARLTNAARASGLSRTEIMPTIISGLRAGAAASRNGRATGGPRRTDTGNVARFVHLFGDDVRYVDEWGSWLVWNGRRWRRDLRSVRVCGSTAAVAQEVRREARSADDQEAREALFKWADTTESAQRRRAIVDLLPGERSLRISHESIDAQPMLLGARNGVLDLESGRLLPHERRYLLTQACPVAWAPAARCPTWVAFLKRVVPAVEDRRFLQRAAGYSLTGRIDEQVLFLLLGAGQNGKTTLAGTLQRLLGNYSVVMPPKMLIQGRNDAHPTTVASLFGKRLAVSSDEAVQGARWDVAHIKQLTGGDRLTARRMREDFWEFDPTHKLWVLANDLPVTGGRGRDAFAVLRRVVVVRFPVVIPESERDPKLPRKLTRELPGILNWALAGLREWKDGGLQVPAGCQLVSDADRARLDPVGAFLAACTIAVAGECVRASVLHQAFVKFAERLGIPPMTATAFGIALQDRLEKKDGRAGRAYLDIALKEPGGDH